MAICTYGQLVEVFENSKGAYFAPKYPTRSAWERGVLEYARQILEYPCFPDGEEFNDNTIEKRFLNGAQDWKEYSEGGCALIYDKDIAERLTPPSHVDRLLRRADKEGGTYLIDVQARALWQAMRLIKYSLHYVYNHTLYQWVTYDTWRSEEGWQVNNTCKTDIYMYLHNEYSERDILAMLRKTVFKSTCRCIAIDRSVWGDGFIEIIRPKDGFMYGRLEEVKF